MRTEQQMLGSWGRVVHRRRWLVLTASAVLLAASGLLAVQGGDLEDPAPLGTTEAGRASRLLREELPRPTGQPTGTSITFVFDSASLAVTDAAYRQAVQDALAPLRTDPRVVSIRTYNDAPAQSAALVSRDGRATLAVVQLRDPRSLAQRYYTELRSLVRSDTLSVLATGSLPIGRDFDLTLDRDLQRAEIVSLPAALVLLALVFGTIVGALLPVGVGILAIVGGIGGVFLLSRSVDVSPYALNIVTLVGLGTAIDYSLFIVARFREELARGAASEDALARSLATAGRAVVFSGVTVMIGLSGMLFFDGTFISSLGLGGAIVVALAVVYALTFLPALLAILGPRVNAWRVPLPRRGTSGPGIWHRIATAVMRRPVAVLIPSIAVVLAAGSPFLHVRLANADTTALPPQSEARRGYDRLVADFPGQEQSTIQVVAFFPGGEPRSSAHDAYVTGLTAEIARLPDVLRVAPAGAGGRIAYLNVVSARPASTDGARDLVRSIRSLADPADGELLVTGQTGHDLDAIGFVAERSVRAIAFIVVMTYVALFLLLRSVLLPLKAVLMNLLSISASFGALVWVIVDGNLAGQLNFTPQALDPAVPVILFCIVFGLSMDYEVLLLSRIQEEYLRTGDNARAVAEGLERSGRLITAAALIMVAVFVGFALADVVIIKSVGIGLAIAVALDATLVRALIVPATMRLLGGANWWAPAFVSLDRHRPEAAPEPAGAPFGR